MRGHSCLLNPLASQLCSQGEETAGGLQVEPSHIERLILFCPSAWHFYLLLCSESGSEKHARWEKVHIWKPFAFTKCLLFLPLTVITRVITDGIQREESFRGLTCGNVFVWGDRDRKQMHICHEHYFTYSEILAFSSHPRIWVLKRSSHRQYSVFPIKIKILFFLIFTFVGSSLTITHL